MPDWVAEQIDMDDYVDYLKPPIGTWDGVTYRISIDGDTHTYAYRTDYYESEDFAAAWAQLAHIQRNQGVLERDVLMIDLRIRDRLVVRVAPGAKIKTRGTRLGKDT